MDLVQREQSKIKLTSKEMDNVFNKNDGKEVKMKVKVKDEFKELKKEFEEKVIRTAFSSMTETELVNEYLLFKKQQEELKKKMDVIKSILKERKIGIEEPAYFTDFYDKNKEIKVQLVVQNRVYVNRKKLEKEFPEVFNEVKQEKQIESYTISEVNKEIIEEE